MYKKLLCLLLALTLCGAPIFGALSEDYVVVEDGDEESMPEEVSGDISLLALDGESAEVDDGSVLPMDTDSNAIVEEASAPSLGYACVTADEAYVLAKPDAQDAVALLNKDGVVLVVESLEGWLRVAFNHDGNTIEGYMAIDALALLTEAETSALMEELATSEDLVLYEDDINRPLTTPAGLVYDGASDGEAAVSAATEDESKAAEDPAQDEAKAAEPGLKLSYSKLTIGVGEKCEILKVTVTPEDGDHAVTWKSSNTKIAKVNKTTGAIAGVKKGTATITAQTSGGLKKTCKVTVKAAPKKVTLNKTALTLSVGQTFTLVGKLPAKTGSTLTFTSGNGKVAAVDAITGEITARATGSATITVKTFNNKKATCKLTVLAAPDQVTLPAKLTIAQNEHRVLKPTVVGADNSKSEAEYTFSAENGTGSVTIDARTGEVVGKEVGTATIRVSTHNGVTTHLSGGERVETVCQVTVVEGPAEVRLAAKSASIGLKQTLALNPVILGPDGEEMKDAKFTVSGAKKNKLTVSAKGVVKGLKKGTYTVTVTALNGVSASCKVKVLAAPSKVSLSPAKPVIGVGQTTKLKVSLPKNTMASYTFSSSNKSVVSVDGEGNITGLKKGSAVIKVRTHNKKTAKVTVKVKDGPSFISLNGTYELEYDDITDMYNVVYSKSLEKGKTFQIKYENEYGTYGAIASYETDDPDVATVTAKGLVTAVEAGVADITVRSTSGATAILRVTVPGDAPKKISFNAMAVRVRVGKQKAAPSLSGTNMTAADLAGAEYASGDEGVFTVEWSDSEAQWIITGVSAGTAMLTASVGSATAQAQVEVFEETDVPKAIHFEDARVYLSAGESFRPMVLDDNDYEVTAVLTSSASGVVSIGDDGVLTAMGEGTATVTAKLGSLTCEMTVVVQAAPAEIKLNVESLKLGVGQRYTLKPVVNGDGTTGKLAYSSSEESVATVTASGVVIGRSSGNAVVTVKGPGDASATCAVTVYPAPTHLSVEPGTISERLNEGGVQLGWSFGASDEMGTVAFSSTNEKVATVSDEGYVTFVSVGMAKIKAVTNNGISVSVDVRVLPEKSSSDETTYRLFAAYSYYDALPFTKRNATTVANVFEKSSISGLTYSTKVMGNPGKTQLLSGISSFFSGTDDNDVSVIYLCSHGHNTKSAYRNYFLSLPGYSSDKNNSNYKITSTEIFNCVKRVRGSVVLILDSCYSGTFIEDMKGKLDDQGGRIAVLTAASNTRATYYNKKSNSVDFFTFFLLQGLGYNERDGWWNKDSKASKGSYPGYLAADKKGNGDGIVSLGEFYDYAGKCIDANIPSYMKKSWYWGDKQKVQKTRFYAGNLKNLVIYKPK